MSGVRVIEILAVTGWNLYLWMSLAIMWAPLLKLGRAPQYMRTIRAELKPFALPLALVYAVPGVLREHSAWSYINLGFALLNWLLLRNIKDEDDDDRWKRRRQKLADKVAEVGGKLQAVPAGSPP